MVIKADSSGVDHDAAILQVEGLSKTFGNSYALEGVHLTVGRGEVVALLGHNGSGKSTLVKVLAGIYKADEGSVALGSAGETRLHFIHQDLGLIPSLSTIENLALSAHNRMSLAPFNLARETQDAEERLGRFGVELDVRAPVATLNPAERAVIAIVRAIDSWEDGDHVLILDEPTATMHADDAARLHESIRSMSAAGAGVIFISHRLDEALDLADRVVVLRNGKVVADRGSHELDHAELVTLVADSEPLERGEKRVPHAFGDVVLRMTNHSAAAFRGVDLDVRKGEIVGVTGVIGSGMDQVIGAAFGAVKRTAGSITVGETTIPSGKPQASINAGIGYVPADRRGKGAVMGMTAQENLTLPNMGAVLGVGGWIDVRKERAEAQSWMDRVSVRPARSEGLAMAQFSGGNQQKIIIARWLRLNPRVFLLEEPTQGVDVGAQAGIHELLKQYASGGGGVLFSSGDALELAAICDRVIVLDRGEVVGELIGDEISEKQIFQAAIGVDHHPGDSRGTTAHDGG